MTGPSSPASLAKMELDTLRCKLGLARTAFRYAQTEFVREKCRREIGDIEAAFTERGEEIPA